METLNKIFEGVFGKSWRTSMMGLAAAILNYFVQLGDNLPTTPHDWMAALFSALLFAWGRMQKATNVSNAPNPVPVAEAVIVPPK